MIIKCGNGEPKDEWWISVCHHCGMPICEQHGYVVASDNAFAELAGTPPAIDPSVPRPRPAPALPRPAMHCRKCVDEFHSGAPRRHGWADPRQAAQGLQTPTGRP